MSVRRLAAAAVLAVSLAALSGCQQGVDLGDLMGAQAPLSPGMVKLIRAGDMGENSPILVRLYKEESELEVWKQKTDGSFALLKTYPICAWSGKLGPKKVEGDRQAPEGFYNIGAGQLNPASNYHLALDIGYPNVYDKANGFTGEHLMVHGSCNSSGCYAMDDWQVEELYALARKAFEGGQRSFQFQAMPFRMTPKNMARHRNSEHYAFWKMLKDGSDRFDLTKKPVAVGVCEKRYVFDETLADGRKLTPEGECPAIQDPAEIVAKRLADEELEKQIAATMAPTDFAVPVSTTYKTGSPITAEAYAAEQHRREGYDRDGNPITAKTSMFKNLLQKKPPAEKSD
ncbi:L,D-transpeptidase family protein [Aureimonas pseudogalii]|uniref:Murein L,D-transpeptidase YafK n=1 Tax=Aureimonas pseudogalii TaxID=1744844 RepID=A0A7W6H2W6_9HYPH|nr:murein L,D-transpeptidase family protein [Aureimonas pseudogalii]MBB3996243.1 murein L,D-transpeptidase YafK [Aureimonas pseudogalii]